MVAERCKMKEKEKIKQVLKENKALIKSTDIDVAESLKGQWFFMRYNPEMDYYDVITRFETAEELIEILLGELSMDLYSSVDSTSEDGQDYKNLADDVDLKAEYKPYIERLIKYMNK